MWWNKMVNKFYYREYRKNKANKKREKMLARKNYRKNRVAVIKRKMKLYYEKNYNRKRILSKYNLTLEQYDLMFEEQGGVCAICGKSQGIYHWKNGTPYRLCVDHDHSTGRVRGLLCTGCNSKLGVIEDAAFNEKAKKYLKTIKLIESKVTDVDKSGQTDITNND